MLGTPPLQWKPSLFWVLPGATPLLLYHYSATTPPLLRPYSTQNTWKQSLLGLTPPLLRRYSATTPPLLRRRSRENTCILDNHGSCMEPTAESRSQNLCALLGRMVAQPVLK